MSQNSLHEQTLASGTKPGPSFQLQIRPFVYNMNFLHNNKSAQLKVENSVQTTFRFSPVSFRAPHSLPQAVYHLGTNFNKSLKTSRAFTLKHYGFIMDKLCSKQVFYCYYHSLTLVRDKHSRLIVSQSFIVVIIRFHWLETNTVG